MATLQNLTSEQVFENSRKGKRFKMSFELVKYTISMLINRGFCMECFLILVVIKTVLILLWQCSEFFRSELNILGEFLFSQKNKLKKAKSADKYKFCKWPHSMLLNTLEDHIFFFSQHPYDIHFLVDTDKLLQILKSLYLNF